MKVLAPRQDVGKVILSLHPVRVILAGNVKFSSGSKVGVRWELGYFNHTSLSCQLIQRIFKDSRDGNWNAR
jgi:hypothetical protein